MSVSDQERIWYYIDSTTKSQRGPIPTNVLLRLLEKGISVGPTTLVWKEGLEKWLMMSEVEAFKATIDFHTRQWYYLDQDNEQKGPIFTRFLLHKLKEGEIDGLTLVFGGNLTEWTKIAEIQELKAEIQKIAEEEERAEAIQKAIQISEAEQVFEASINPTELFDSLAVKAKLSEENARNKEKRTFIADDGIRYKWDEEDESWVVDDEEENEEEEGNEQGKDRKRKASAAELEENDDGNSSHDDDDGSVKEENKDAQENGKDQQQEQQKQKKKRKNKKRKNKGPNTWIYVTGLPPNVTEEELKAHFSKVGIIALNPLDQQPKIKIYRDEDDLCKGDCLICFNAEESVKLALEILHEGYIRPNFQIFVTRATFENHSAHGEHQQQPDGGGVATKKKSHVSQAQIKVAKNAVKQALTWNEDDDMGITKASALRIIVLESMFTLEEITTDELVEELEKDVAEEVGKIGEIEKITMFTKNPKGIIVIKFTTAFAAQECIRIMNGRFFGGRKIKSYFWDGVANYSVVPQSAFDEEEEKKEEARLDEFGDWLEHEQEDLPEEFQLKMEQ